MAADLDNLYESIANLTLSEASQLVKMMEEKLGISAQAVAVASGPAQAAEAAAPVEEKTEFDVILESFGENKVNVIKVIRGITGLGLKEAKALVEGAPAPVKEGVPKEEAEKVQKELEEAGAKVAVK